MSKDTNHSQTRSNELHKYAYVVPHTHWDREWYLPFQSFRTRLIKLVRSLYSLLENPDFYFTFDGQTVVLEDYLEVFPQDQESLTNLIRSGKLSVGPWYILADEWLVSGESLIRNLEYSVELAQSLNIPLNNVGYLPDQFGHSCVIPQLLHDIADIHWAVIWRGVPEDITTTPFIWKRTTSSKAHVKTIYLATGYFNAAELPTKPEALEQAITEKIRDLESFAITPLYLLMNGVDHMFPNPDVLKAVKALKPPNIKVKITTLAQYIEALENYLQEKNTRLPIYAGEHRSSARAHLLQDTYSSRMWIKQWNQKIEDLLTRYAEPLQAYASLISSNNTLPALTRIAWKWLLRNHAHDSICGTSIDQVHEEMKTRFSWAETIAQEIISSSLNTIKTHQTNSAEPTELLIFNPTNTQTIPAYIEFVLPLGKNPEYLEIGKKRFPIQELNITENKYWELETGGTRLKTMLKLVQGRKVGGIYINEVYITPKGETCEIKLIAHEEKKGDLNISELKQNLIQIIDSKQYTKFHVLILGETNQKLVAIAPLSPWGFTKAKIISVSATNDESPPPRSQSQTTFSKNKIETPFHIITFKKNGTMTLTDKKTGKTLENLHYFEDWGDRGDLYTFGKVGPEKAKPTKVKRKITSQGPLFTEIEQTMHLEVFKEINPDRTKRKGKILIPVKTTFRFYTSHPRIDIKTTLTNNAKDHRLRICFEMPFETHTSITETHFGYIERPTDPIGDPEKYPEKPSGIQPQKRFIRVNPSSNFPLAITLFNKGLPEVEVVDGKYIALTLLRAIGWMSRADYSERPEHAGPQLETPGAQELEKQYEYEYALLIHPRTTPMHEIQDHAEAFALQAIATPYSASKLPLPFQYPLIAFENPNIRITSLRRKHDYIIITTYNSMTESQETRIITNPLITHLEAINIHGAIKSTIPLSETSLVKFAPHEIKLLRAKIK